MTAIGQSNLIDDRPLLAESCGGALPDTSRSPISRVSSRYPRRLRSVGEKLHKSRSPAMRNVYDAFISSAFCYPPNQLTVFPGAGIAGKFLPSEIPSNSFA
jgi:hypothetical protein